MLPECQRDVAMVLYHLEALIGFNAVTGSATLGIGTASRSVPAATITGNPTKPR